MAVRGGKQILKLTCLAAKFHPATIHCTMATALPLVPGAFSNDQWDGQPRVMLVAR